jgi:hypothetical protein
LKVSFETNVPQFVTRVERPPCPLCGGQLHFSHREYAGAGRSVAVLRCGGCCGVIRGEARDDRGRPGPVPRHRRELPEGGQPDNYVLDPTTADRLLRALEADAPAPGE